MKHIYNQHVNAITNSLKRLFKQPISLVFILIMLGIALSLPLTFYLSVQSFENILNKITTEPSLTIFMKNQASEKQISNVANILHDHQEIKKVVYISKKKALKETAQIIGQTDLEHMFDENPLPDSFVVTPKNLNPDSVQKLALSLEKLPFVNQVKLDSRWVKTLYQIKTFLSHILLFLSLTLSFTFILISYNTTRLQILTCRDEIEVSHLLGASSSFIRRPFLYQAFWQAFLTILLGIIISNSVMSIAINQAKNIFSPYGIELQKRLFSIYELFGISLIVIFLALMGAAWATWQFLREFK